MEKPEPDAPVDETFEQVLVALKGEYDVSDSEISRRLGTHHSTVSNWANGDALPRQKALMGLAELFPKYKARLYAAAKKRVPAPLPPDRKDAVLEVFDRLTEEQQKMALIQLNAVADSNDQ